MEKMYISAKEVSEKLDISESMSYRLIRQMNEELKIKGFLTLSGKVSRKFFQEKFYGAGE